MWGRVLPPLTSTLLGLSQRHLSEPGGVRDMAGVLLGRLLTRPDCQAALHQFLVWARTHIQDRASPRAVFAVPGQRQSNPHSQQRARTSEHRVSAPCQAAKILSGTSFSSCSLLFAAQCTVSN